MSFTFMKVGIMIDISMVYIGYNKDNERCLLYMLDDNIFENLESKKIYTREEIYMSSLVKYRDVIEYSSLFENSIVERYKESENKLINLKDLYITDLYEISEIKGVERKGSKLETICSLKIIKKSILVLERFLMFTDMFTNKLYNSGHYHYVEEQLVKETELIPFESLIKTKEEVLPKRKVLELYVDMYGIK